MPELPEVETVVRGLRADLEGRTITSATIYWANTSPDVPSHHFNDRIQGQTIRSLARRAKYVVLNLSTDVMLVHLRMTGRLYVTKPTEDPDNPSHLRAEFGLDNGLVLRFYDMRKFGKIYLVTDIEQITGKLGPEPLSDAFTEGEFRERLRGRNRAIKPLLLDQTFVAGVGNIYADESLWMSEIDPRRKADTLEEQEIVSLYENIRTVLADAIEHEGSSFSWYLKPDGSKGEHQNHFRVYDRKDEPCLRCGTPISKIKLAQRGTHFCANCQS